MVVGQVLPARSGRGPIRSERRRDLHSGSSGFDLEIYNDPLWNSIVATVYEALDAGLYRFDASDQLPVEIAFGPLHSALTEYVSNPGASAQSALSSIEVAWTEYEANSSGG